MSPPKGLGPALDTYISTAIGTVLNKLVKLNPARCARLVKLSVVKLAPVGATTPIELY